MTLTAGEARYIVMNIGHIDLDKTVLVVAEIGNNHAGSYSLAEEMIGRAAEAGAEAVKFQTIVPERLVTRDQTDRLAQLKRICLGYGEFERLAKVAAAEGVLFMSTPFDLDSLAMLAPLVAAITIASGDNNCYPLIEAAARTDLPLVVSSGAATMAELTTLRDRIRRVWAGRASAPDLAILHCVMAYPTPPSSANLGAIEKIRALGVTAGYSDHTIGVDAAPIAVALGARLIEKHFTIDKFHSDFRDHQLSADPDDLKEMIVRIRGVEQLIGDGEKRVLEVETANRDAVRRSLAAARDMAAGEVIDADGVTWLRPGTGFPPDQESTLIGRRLTRAIAGGELFTAAHIGIATDAAD